MAKTFKNITQNNQVSLWTQFLEYQAALCIKKDISFFTHLNAIHFDAPILEFGCGVGAYTEQLRSHLPHIPIVATDFNLQFLNVLSQRLEKTSDHMVSTHQWDALNGPAPLAASACQTCIIRLVLQHVTDPISIVNSIKKILPKGSQIIIIEEDDDLIQVHPHADVFTQIMHLWKRYGNKYHNTRYMGRKLPKLIHDCQLKLCHYDIISHSNIENNTHDMAKFYIDSLPPIQAADESIMSDNEFQKIKSLVQDYVKKHADHCIITYPQVIAIAEIV